MSLFHGYNEIPKPDNVMTMPISPCKTTYFNPKGHKKPKGLSIRSDSDMNVFHNTLPTSAKENTGNPKESKISKSKIVKQDNSGHQTYSLKGKFSNYEYRSTEGEKREIDKDKKMEKVLSDTIFKAPIPPEKFAKQIREPENLAHFYNAQYEFDYKCVETMEQGFMDLLLEVKDDIMPCEKEDLETLLPVEIPEIILPSFFDEEYMELPSPELPYISDEDIFY
ncbi:PREDICTED: uncharacterized protein LOC106746630 [Dinoponera quadriceps]|uniref:Uncharacterized protein LOC106746630 n=1 Tax=Dinoponera quadriceps TaxID=609295 RepID=A0A6P3XKW6_DINQU|nr:PREDICTED: uncharacterized protein LOC106746630 [Dinoponera quadriceps]